MSGCFAEADENALAICGLGTAAPAPFFQRFGAAEAELKRRGDGLLESRLEAGDVRWLKITVVQRQRDARRVQVGLRVRWPRAGGSCRTFSRLNPRVPKKFRVR